MKRLIKVLCGATIVLRTCGFMTARGQDSPLKTSVVAHSAVSTLAQQRERQEWVARCLKDMQSIKVGMTRANLSQILTTEGGIYSPGWGHYIHPDCPYFKVDAEFDFSRDKNGRGTFKPTDKITKVSKPYLEEAIID